MQITPSEAAQLGPLTWLKKPAVDGPPAQRDPKVIARVTEMLTEIERRGLDAVRAYSEELDGWSGSLELGEAELRRSGDALPPDVRAALELGHERTNRFALAQREHLTDFEIELAPSVICGQRYVPVGRVGAYLPAGRFPLLASAFMTVGVAKAAGVPAVLACTPPSGEHGAHPAVLYGAYLSGADRVFTIGGVQALGAMAFGLLDEAPVDMLVGAGNAFVTEAKRQLFGKVGIDLLAGPSEVAVIADETADPEWVAADLLGQAEHGPNSPSALVTTSESFGRQVVAAIERQLETLATREIAGAAWRDYGSVVVAADARQAAEVSDVWGPEHLEIQTADDEYFLENLTNYGSLFLGRWSTVAYSDKGIAGTNHVLPTGKTSRYNAGLSVSRFLKPLTYQRAGKEGTPALAPSVERVSAFEGLAAHEATATIRIDEVGRHSGAFEGTPAVDRS
ncbi:histidinol dehydrogenase [Prauserella marina]|uniref:Histidinol dehydrogenase n=1 Tax=Prauserella marina TaxID=530584 RepID=A0A222VT91_9PSEU|nr:histidinol dehydrogenase [Prauserella marina]ASR37052.1 histidinol dehydrogenase [Prauserella marina]PWV79968.1 sulfopropanediol 3-dehydrogenase [Prauserella marina]SDD86011.1 sulfopropanediol 3-dehydrogenase [Prauserella marina]